MNKYSFKIFETTVFEKEIPYLLVVSYEDNGHFKNIPLSSDLYIRIFDNRNDLIFGTWTEILKSDSHDDPIVKRATETFTDNTLKTFIDYAEKIEKMKAFL